MPEPTRLFLEAVSAVARGLAWGKDVVAKPLAEDKEAHKVLFNQR